MPLEVSENRSSLAVELVSQGGVSPSSPPFGYLPRLAEHANFREADHKRELILSLSRGKVGDKYTPGEPFPGVRGEALQWSSEAPGSPEVNTKDS